MSMLDDIKAAEAAAAQAKKEAALTSRNLLRDAEEAANREAAAMITEARAAAKETVAKAEADARVKAKELVEERARADRAVAVTAEEKLSDAVAYIVERVVV
jgi:colicin import membrane protein